jgi:endo-1,4-beta-xylanase
LWYDLSMIKRQAQTSLFPANGHLLTGADPTVGKFAYEGTTTTRIEVLQPSTTQPWAVNAKTPFFPAIRHNDLLDVAFEIRCVSSKASDKRGVFAVYMQVDKGQWEGIANVASSIPADGKWRAFHIAGKASKDFVAETVNVVWQVATVGQVLEIRSVVGSNLGDKPLSVIPVNPVDYVGREKDAPWRSEADRLIKKHRKGTLNISVVDKAGKPISNAEVSVNLTRHAYAFGSFTDAAPALDTPDAERYRKTMESVFNRVTIPWYWSDWGTESPQEHANYDKIATWAHKSGFEIKAHCLIYPHYLPSAVIQANKEARKAAIFKQIEVGMAETKKYNVAVWDVLNELRNDTDLEKEYGFGIYAEIFKRAKKNNTKARLFINENDIEAVSGAMESKVALYEKQIAQMLADGAPLEGIALQGHFGEDLPAPDLVWKALDRFAKFGVPLEIAEFDMNIRDEAAQADYMRDYITAVFAHPATTSVTLWGFWEGSIWQKDAALIRKDWTPKPAWTALTTLIQQTWHTKATGRADKAGSFATNGFYGTYEVIVKAGGKTTKATILHQKGVTKTQKITV